MVNCLNHTVIFLVYLLPSPTHTHIDSLMAEAAVHGADLLITSDKALSI